MRTSLMIFAAAGLLLFPFATYAADNGQTYDVPPVAQPLVREGDFAIKLAALYGLGAPANETEAEDLLSSAGVIPLNGWISDYPVTPEILGQLQEAAARAASEGRLPMGADKAAQLLYDLASQMNLPVPAGPEAAAAAAQNAPAQPDIYNYYTGYGPPIITYYPPPPAYFYLYAWVPYPVWWYGFWYPGFYICNNFSTTIVVDSRTVFVRNRFVDPATRRFVRIEPVVRAGDAVHPRTILRTNDGRTYRNVREMRQGIVSGDVEQGGRGTRAIRPPGAGGFRSPDDRRSAQDIYKRSLERQGPAGQAGLPAGNVVGRGDDKRRSPQSAAGGSYTAPPRSERHSGNIERSAGTPGRSYSPRSYDHPAGRESRQFQGSAAGGRPQPSVTPLPSGRPYSPPRPNEQRSPGRPGQESVLSPAGPGPSSGPDSYTPQVRGDEARPGRRR